MQNNKTLVRFLEIVPGLATWVILLSPLLLSFYLPQIVAYFVILFDLYWLFRSMNLSHALIKAYRNLSKSLKKNWTKKLENSGFTYEDIYHVVVFPFYNEGLDVLEPSVRAAAKSDYNTKKKVIFVLAVEERGGDIAIKNAKYLKRKFQKYFFELVIAIHPDGVVGEAKAKSANINYAIRKVEKEVINKHKLDHKNTIVLSIDSDTRIHKQLFSCLTYQYFRTEDREKKIFQFITLFHNNVWEVPAVMRLISTANSFWIMIESTRPHRLRCFSCYACSLFALKKAKYWDKTSIIEDGVQYWRNMFAFGDDHSVIPVYIPVYMHAVMNETYFSTYHSQYVQLRRWAWGASDLSIIIPEFLKNKKISLKTKILETIRLLDNHLTWSTAPLLLLLLGWLPLMNQQFSETILAYNLPQITSSLLTLALLGISASLFISLSLLPRSPDKYPLHSKIGHILQWILTPAVTIFLGSLPAIDAQTRLALGKRLEFIVTSKSAKK